MIILKLVLLRAPEITPISIVILEEYEVTRVILSRITT